VTESRSGRAHRRVTDSDDAIVRASDGGDDHDETAPWFTGSLAPRHELRPNEPGLVVERQNAAREQGGGSTTLPMMLVSRR
jgi:hypothetical protein